jgi:hypothetical protein
MRTWDQILKEARDCRSGEVVWLSEQEWTQYVAGKALPMWMGGLLRLENVRLKSPGVLDSASAIGSETSAPSFTSNSGGAETASPSSYPSTQAPPATTSVERVAILQDAARLTSGDRDKEYGPPIYNMTCAGELKVVFRRWLVRSITPAEQEAIDMVLTKLSRLSCGKPKRDTYVDAAAYCAIAGECALHPLYPAEGPVSLTAYDPWGSAGGEGAEAGHTIRGKQWTGTGTDADGGGDQSRRLLHEQRLSQQATKQSLTELLSNRGGVEGSRLTNSPEHEAGQPTNVSAFGITPRAGTPPIRAERLSPEPDPSLGEYRPVGPQREAEHKLSEGDEPLEQSSWGGFRD